MHYLLKTEPTVYSFANLQRDKATIWDGVTNPTAVRHLREMKPGSSLLMSISTGAPSALARALGFQLAMNGVVASTAPTAPVSAVALTNSRRRP